MELRFKQKQFLSLALEGKNICLSGKAGTGKTYVVKKLMEHLNEKGLNVVACAPTGVAALNIGGSTIHSLFSIGVNGVMSYDKCNFVKSEKRSMFRAIDVIIFDEISMLRPDLLDAINWTLLKNGCGKLSDKQLIFVGDLKQLPPTITDNEKSVLLNDYDDVFFYNSNIYNKIEVESIELDEIVRQNDPEFIEALNIIRDGGKSEYFRQFVKDYPSEDSVILTPYTQSVEYYNKIGLDKIDSNLVTYTASIHIEDDAKKLKASDFNFEQTINVKEGAKIMYLINSKSHNELINGTIGTYRVENNIPYIEVNGILFKLEPVELEKNEYVLIDDTLKLKKIGSISQYPFKLAYAMTIHKSQGLTFDNVTIDLSRPCFQPGQMYTALSRASNPKGLTIITKRN